ncbi:MAG TPA: carboxypeptidase-like regulatory domain-containing protein, partial [Bryobacteraceae bacterium]|nr:carboxypeptidase-like regulatory domain-containing protein [Bryobacteraceae bacterium]
MKKLLFVLATLALAAVAQTFFGSIVGTVSDATGASVPNATVNVINTGTSDRRTAQTDAQGNYQFVNLVPGVYRVEIEKQGFQRLTRDQIQVQVQAAVRINAAMQVGDVTQTVEVSAAAPLLQTEQANLSQVVEGRAVQDLALNGRNVLNLVGLVPGVVPQGSSSGNPMGNQNGGAGTNVNGWGNYQIGGGAANQSASYLDGAPLNVSYINAVILVPTTDAIQEFRVVTNNVSPEFGRFAGGIVNLTTRSGTNQFHGNLYEFLRNRSLNANNFFSNRAGVARPPFVQNQYGANVSGPAIKDKTFFMFTWEGFKYRQGIPTVTTVPTAAMRNGDFSAPGLPTIYDPLTVCGMYNNAPCATDSKGNPIYTRSAFPGNKIPTNRMDPTARAMLNFWALPTQSGTVNNWVGNGIAGGDQYQTNYRVDHDLSDKQRLFARYTRWVGNTIPNDLFHDKIANAVYYGTDNAVIGDTYTLSPSTVLDIRGSYLRFISGFNPLSNGADLSQFGPAYAQLQNQVTFPQYPLPQVQGMLGAAGQPVTWNTVTARNTSNNYDISGSVTKAIGRHTWKFGGESRRIEWYFGQTNFSTPQFLFDSGFTAQNALSSTGSGYPFASFLLGLPASGQAKEIGIPGQTMFYHGYYASDTFNLTRKLTINYGVRWEYPGVFREKHDSATVFLPTASDPLGAQTGLNLKGVFALVNSALYPDRGIMPAKLNGFSPRIGLAYRLNDRTVIRAGYGLSYLPNDIIFDN